MKNQTYMVQVVVGHKFEDLYVQARSPEQAIEKAKKVATLKHKFAKYVI